MKCPSRRLHGFTAVDNGFIRDNELSYKAKGVLLQMCSLPEEWDYSVNGLVALSTDGHTSTESALRELEERGYLVRSQRREGGRFVGYEYVIYESLADKDEDGEAAPFPENPPAVNHAQLNTIGSMTYSPSLSQGDNRTVNQRERDRTDNQDNCTEKARAKADERHAYGSLKNVLLTDQQHATLKAMYPDLDQRIEDMSLYCSAHGKAYKNYYTALLNWARMEKKRNKDKHKDRWADGY